VARPDLRAEFEKWDNEFMAAMRRYREFDEAASRAASEAMEASKKRLAAWRALTK